MAEKRFIFPVKSYYLSCEYGDYEYDGKFHGGDDYGYHDETDKYCEVWAAKSGLVVYSNFCYTASRGNVIILRHDNGDGTYQYTSYYHLNARSVSQGATVKQGDVIGYRGGTKDGKSFYGVHLHFGISTITNKLYSGYDAVYFVANNNISPKGQLFLSRDKEYMLMHTVAPSEEKSASGRYRDLREVKIMPPEPVARDEKVHQYSVNAADIYLRYGYGLNAEKMGFIAKGIYNVVDIQEADGYTWYGIGDDYYSAYLPAVCTDYPVADERDKKIAELTEENAKLKEKIDNAIAILSEGK